MLRFLFSVLATLHQRFMDIKGLVQMLFQVGSTFNRNRGIERPKASIDCGGLTHLLTFLTDNP